MVCDAMLHRSALPLEDPRPGDDVALDGDVDLGPVVHLGDDFVAAVVDDERVFGARRADARAPGEGHVLVEHQARFGPQAAPRAGNSRSSSPDSRASIRGDDRISRRCVWTRRKTSEMTCLGREKKMQVASTIVASE